MLRVLISAGEPSGDFLGARLLHALSKRRNNLEFSCLGGRRLTDSGATVVYPLADQAVVGFVEVLRHLREIRRARKKVLRYLDNEPPDLVIPIDYPGFNISLAQHAHRRGIPAAYYVSPQVWAWRPGRVKHIGRAVQKVLVLFPFEVETYEEAGVPVEWVGHPLLDVLDPKRRAESTLLRPEKGFTLGLLPGSRPAEIRNHLPEMARAADMIARDAGRGACRCVLVVAHELSMQTMAHLLANEVFGASILPPEASLECSEVCLKVPGPLENIVLVRDPDYTHRAGLDIAITASGTATLENAILGVPTVIVYRLNQFSYMLARRLVRVPYIGIVNLIARREICPELIQDRANADEIGHAVIRILDSENLWHQMKQDMDEVRRKLGPPGASERAADAILRTLDGESVSSA